MNAFSRFNQWMGHHEWGLTQNLMYQSALYSTFYVFKMDFSVKVFCLKNGFSDSSNKKYWKGDKWRPPTRARTFGARHLALWTFGAQTIGALDNWHPGHFAPGHLAVGTIGALENWRSGTFGARTFGAPDVWRPKKLPFS